MEIRYSREMNHNYMIIEAPEMGGGYECRMLAANAIEGLLKFRMRYCEEKREFYYEITSKQPLKRLLDQRKIKGTEIRRLLLGISAVLGRIEEYLLKEEQILLEADYIYLNPDDFTVGLCLLPGYSGDFPSALSKLLQYLLEKVDYQDKEGVVMAYNLYHESLKENYGMSDLLESIAARGEKDKIFKREREKQDSDEAYRDEEKGKEQTDSAWKMDYGREWENQSRYPSEGIHSQRQNGRGDGTRSSPGDRTGADIERQREDTEGRADKKSKMKRTVIGIQYGIMAGAAEGVIWYFTGTEGLMSYGPFVILAAIVLILLQGVLSRKTSKENEKPHLEETKQYGRLPETENIEQRNFAERQEVESYRLNTESEEEYRLRRQREEAEQSRIKEDRVEGTTLLTELNRGDGMAVFESLSREVENMEISYVPFVIGKHPELADGCLHKPTVSRLHLRIDKKENVYIVTDLNSTNGTTVEGYQLQANETVSIKNGDIIYIADLGFKFSENYNL